MTTTAGQTPRESSKMKVLITQEGMTNNKWRIVILDAKGNETKLGKGRSFDSAKEAIALKRRYTLTKQNGEEKK